MKEIPLLCKPEVVRAILEGRQTQDRRPVKPQPPSDTTHFEMQVAGPTCIDAKPGTIFYRPIGEGRIYAGIFSPYQVGDHLWVRETFGNKMGFGIAYKADQPADSPYLRGGITWKPSIHMPKWACRLWLEVTGVRAERVREISATDAFWEGFNYRDVSGELQFVGDHPSYALFGFKYLWGSLYPGSWERNDWVWVTEFRRIK